MSQSAAGISIVVPSSRSTPGQPAAPSHQSERPKLTRSERPFQSSAGGSGPVSARRAPARRAACVALGRGQPGRRPGEPLFDGDRFDARHQGPGLGDELVVARGKGEGRTEGAGDRRVQAELADRQVAVGAAAHDDVGDLEQVGVRECGAGRPGPRVVADHEDGVEPSLDSGHHAELGAAAADQRDAGRQPGDAQVVAAVVGVADDDLVGAGFEAALEHGLEVAAHEPARGLPVVSAVVGLGQPADAAYALEIDADEDLHVSTSRGRRWRMTTATTISTIAIAAVTRKVINGPLDLAVAAPPRGCTYR